MTRATGPRVPDLLLERYRLGELPRHIAADIEARSATDPALRARLEAIGESDRAIAEQYGEAWLVRRLQHDRTLDGTGASRPDRGVRWTAPAKLALVTAATVVLAVAGWQASVRWLPEPGGEAAATPGGRPSGSADDARVKGDAAALLVYRRLATSSELLADGESARAGDVLRLAYRTSSPRFGVIVSMDGRGVVTRHLPTAGDAAVRLEAGEATPLDMAYEMDDAPRWELFVLVTSDVPFDFRTVLDAVRRAATAATAEPPQALDLPRDWSQTSFLVRKTD